MLTPQLKPLNAVPQLQSPTGPIPQLGAGPSETALDKFSGFTRSAIESIPELFGIAPSFETESYRAKNPVGSFASQALGYLAPYAGEMKLLEGAKALEGLNAGIRAIDNPVLRGAARGAVDTAIFEGSRTALAATPVPAAIYDTVTGSDKQRSESLGNLAGEGALNTLAGGALGGVVGGIGAKFAGGVKIHDLVPGAAPDQPLARQVQALTEALQNPELAPEVRTRLQAEADRRARFNLTDTNVQYGDNGAAMAAQGYAADQGELYRPLVGENKSNQIGSFLNRIQRWTGKPDGIQETKRAIYEPGGEGGFATAKALDDALNAAGTDKQTLGTWAQNVRVVGVKPGAKAADYSALKTALDNAGEAQRSLTSTPEVSASSNSPLSTRAATLQKRFTYRKVWTPVGDGWNLAQEPNGLYVMSKKVAGDLAQPEAGDQWLFFRTANPEKFATQSSNLRAINDIQAFFPKAPELEKINEPLWDAGADINNLHSKGVATKKFVQKGRVGAAIADTAETAGTYVSPTTMLGTRNPKLNRAFDYLKSLNGVVKARVGNFLHGERTFEPDKNLLQQTLKLVPEAKPAFADFIRTFTPDDIKDIQTVLEEAIPFDKVEQAYQRGIFSENTHLFLREMQLRSDDLFKRMDALNEQVSTPAGMRLLKDFAERQGHYGITRNYGGQFTQYLTDDVGNVIGKTAGNTPQEAIEKADKVIANEAGRGRTVHRGGTVSEVLRTPESLEMFRNSTRKPGFTKSRGDLIGFDYGIKPMTNQDLIKLVESNLTRRENYLRDVVIAEQLAPQMTELQRQFPQDALALQNVINRMQGNEGAFAQVQNKIVDKMLQSVGLAGTDSATAIVRTTQRIMNAAQFTFGNVTNPLLNIIGIAQTVLPEVAYGLYASPETLARNYAAAPIYNKAGQVAGSLNFLSPMKLFHNAMNWVATPWKDLPPVLQQTVKELTADGTISARGVEEQFGVDGHILADPLKAFKDGQSFVRLLNSANELLMTKTEEVSRLMGVMSGYELAVARGIPEERIPYFVRSFVAKTSYNFGVADRAHIFTGPIGSLAGTFKNWMFHYMGSMVKYATGGKEALPALLWQTGTTAIVGGAAATPLILPMANAASKFFTDKTAMQNLYDLAGADNQRWADGVMYGLPGIFGLSLASQAAAPGADPARDANMLFSFAVAQRMKNLSDATKDALTLYAATGQSPFESDVVRAEMMRALAPRSVYRAMSATMNGAISSPTTGYSVMDGVSPGTAIAYAAGFNPVELDKTYEVYSQIRDNQQAQKLIVTQMGKALAQALETGDQETADAINARAMALGIDYSGVLRSAQSVDKRRQQTQLNFTASPEDQQNYSFMFNQDQPQEAPDANANVQQGNQSYQGF